VGLGACDIKGAAAVLFALAERTDAPMHLVLSTDEEAGQSTCIRRYLETPPDVDFAVVAEPTSVQPILQHRGIVSNRVTFTGASAHSSETSTKSAVHDAARWAVAVLDHPASAPNRLNVGRVEGGVKPNMVAASAEILFGFRHAPGMDHNIMLADFDRLLPEGAERHLRFEGPALPADSDGPAAAAQARAADYLKAVGLVIGEPVNFWTEASLFAAAGVPVAVIGPGHIAQAHTADEWVALSDLAAAFTAYERIVNHG
ncbi:MAG: M20/M25/M40 family metallo-hydrolase, partial [Pseudomonadota bacterium]